MSKRGKGILLVLVEKEKESGLSKVVFILNPSRNPDTITDAFSHQEPIFITTRPFASYQLRLFFKLNIVNGQKNHIYESSIS